jgi:hypothetical protein
VAPAGGYFVAGGAGNCAQKSLILQGLAGNRLENVIFRWQKPGPWHTFCPSAARHNQQTTMTTRPAHTIVPGDSINGKVVFDLIRQAFGGGYYIPFEDGTRFNVATAETLVRCD